MVGSNKSRGNITASFGADFFQQGSTSIPNLLLKYYKKIGLTDMELILIIHLLRFKCEENNPFPAAEYLSTYMASDATIIQGILNGLMEKDILSQVHYYDEISEEAKSAYAYDSLFERISDIWARDKMKELQKVRRTIKKNHEKVVNDIANVNLEKYFTQVHKSFEREFGRLLSPMEIEQIQAWLAEDKHNPDIIMEALRRAVLMGKHNFKYIDTILLEWKKNNIQTSEDINKYDVNFKQRQGGNKPRNISVDKVKADNKKDKIKMLYYNL